MGAGKAKNRRTPLFVTLPRKNFSPAHSSNPDHLGGQLSTDLPEATVRIIRGYCPRRRTGAWDEVQSFVVDCVLKMAPTTPTNARRLMTMTALYVTWMWAVTGSALTVSRVFKSHLVDRYVAEQLSDRSPVYRYDTVRQLAAIGQRLGGVHIERRPLPDESGSARPYSADEFAMLYSWATTLSTPFKRQNAAALLGLSAGAGLSAQEVMDANVDDIVVDGGRLFVAVRGDRARLVPVRREWTRLLTLSTTHRTSGYLFRAHRLDEYEPHGLQRFLSDNPGQIRPSAARLRAGWIISQINSNLPLSVLLQITGFASLGSLQPYLEHTKCHPIYDHLSLIIGEQAAS